MSTWGGGAAGQVPRWVVDSDRHHDELADDLERRIEQLEEVIAARWPRRILAAARLRRSIRRSIRHVQGGDFGEKRAEWATTWHLNDRRLLRLPDDAFRLFVNTLLWSVANKTDGVACDPAADRPRARSSLAAGLVTAASDTRGAYACAGSCSGWASLVGARRVSGLHRPTPFVGPDVSGKWRLGRGVDGVASEPMIRLATL